MSGSLVGSHGNTELTDTKDAQRNSDKADVTALDHYKTTSDLGWCRLRKCCTTWQQHGLDLWLGIFQEHGHDRHEDHWLYVDTPNIQNNSVFNKSAEQWHPLLFTDKVFWEEGSACHCFFLFCTDSFVCLFDCLDTRKGINIIATMILIFAFVLATKSNFTNIWNLVRKWWVCKLHYLHCYSFSTKQCASKLGVNFSMYTSTSWVLWCYNMSLCPSE